MKSITTVPPRDLDFLPDELFLPVTVSLDVTAKGPLKKMTSITTVPPRDLVFLSDEFSLPATVSFDVTVKGSHDQIIPWFTSNRKFWGDDDCDALSWYLAPDRDAFSFRFRGYNFDHPTKQLLKLRAVPGKSHRMECTITPTSAVYSIDGKKYATVNYPVGTLGSNKGYFGFDSGWNQQPLTVENLEIKSASVPSTPPLPAVSRFICHTFNQLLVSKMY